MVNAPWARVTGRVILPDAYTRGPAGGVVIFDPVPETVTATVDGGTALVVRRTVCRIAEDGTIVSPTGDIGFVDLVAPGSGVTPAGAWAYDVTVRVPREESWTFRATLVQGTESTFVSIVPPVAPGGAVDNEAVAAALAAAQSAARDLAAVRAEVAAGRIKGEKGEPGEKGKDAETPRLTAAAQTLDAGQDATASVTGEYPDLRIELGIPRGEKGDGADLTEDAVEALPLAGKTLIDWISSKIDASYTKVPSWVQGLQLTDGETLGAAIERLSAASGSGGPGTPGAPGKDAENPRFSVSASSVASDQPAGVDLSGDYPDLSLAFRIPRGEKGADGAPGRNAENPRLTVVARTLDAGESATASISGSYPDLELSLGLPRGERGPEGPKGEAGVGGGWTHPLLLSGLGRPDHPETTNGAIKGDEAVGTEYRSIDGAGVGAWVWMRRPTGWVVTDGDTGWRDVGSLIPEAVLDGAPEPGFLTIRRAAGWVTARLNMVWLTTGGAAGVRFKTAGANSLIPMDTLIAAGLAPEVLPVGGVVVRRDRMAVSSQPLVINNSEVPISGAWLGLNNDDGRFRALRVSIPNLGVALRSSISWPADPSVWPASLLGSPYPG